VFGFGLFVGPSLAHEGNPQYSVQTLTLSLFSFSESCPSLFHLSIEAEALLRHKKVLSSSS